MPIGSNWLLFLLMVTTLAILGDFLMGMCLLHLINNF